METLKVQMGDEIENFNKEEFNNVMNALFGSEDKHIHTYDSEHPFMQHVHLYQSSLFDDLKKMIYGDHQIEILDADENTVLVVSKV